MSTLTGVSKVPGLGLLSTSPTGGANAAIVFRTWGLTRDEATLQPGFYGTNFTYRERMQAKFYITGMLTHYTLIIGAYLLSLRAVRTVAKKVVFKPGHGPDVKNTKNEYIELRGVAKPDGKLEAKKQVFGKLSYTGSMYYRES